MLDDLSDALQRGAEGILGGVSGPSPSLMPIPIPVESDDHSFPPDYPRNAGYSDGNQLDGW